MDLPPGVIELLDQYVSDALDATGTNQAREREHRAAMRLPSVIVEIEDEEDPLIPIHLDFDDRTNPDLQNQFAEEEGTAWMAPALRPDAEVDPLPRGRAPRSSANPIVEVDEDEVTNLVGKPVP